MRELFETKKDVVEYIFRITDNGGASSDRYTVQFTDGQWLGLSSYPGHPLGYSQAGDSPVLYMMNERVDESILQPI